MGNKEKVGYLKSWNPENENKFIVACKNGLKKRLQIQMRTGGGMDRQTIIQQLQATNMLAVSTSEFSMQCRSCLGSRAHQLIHYYPSTAQSKFTYNFCYYLTNQRIYRCVALIQYLWTTEKIRDICKLTPNLFYLAPARAQRRRLEV